MVKYLEWDSKFFKFSVGKIEIISADLLNEINLTKIDYDLIYLFVSPNILQPNNVQNIIGNHLLADNKLTFVKSTSHNNDCIGGIRTKYKIRSADIRDNNEEFWKLAFESGKYSRFNLDKKFPNQLFQKLYIEWIRNSLSREIASEVYCIEACGNIAGMITLGEKNNRVDIGLIAVNEQFQGLGLGSILLNKANEYAEMMGYKEVQVVTQGKNFAACNFYLKNGFKKVDEINIFHIWNKNYEYTFQ